MRELNQNWITEGLIDFEYKKYILLAYLQTVKESFNEKKLYPYLGDLLFHYKNLLSIKENKQLIHENFPKEISKADFDKLQIIYKEIVNDDRIMAEIEDIIGYSLPKMQSSLKEGKELYDEIEDKLSISPVGIFPLHPEEGYLFFYIEGGQETKIYEYQITIFENSEERFRGVHTSFIGEFRKGIGTTFESIKIDLVKRYKKLPNPGAFLINTQKYVPFDESLLPIAKRLLVKHIYSAA